MVELLNIFAYCFRNFYLLAFYLHGRAILAWQASPDYKGVCHIALAQEGHCRPGQVGFFHKVKFFILLHIGIGTNLLLISVLIRFCWVQILTPALLEHLVNLLLELASLMQVLY